ncbi:ATP-dependent DNA helicase [Epidermidibacterium keratini]|nr:AAA family ATPase [Epidermidibacterium keratini]
MAYTRPVWPADTDRVFAEFCEGGLWPGMGHASVLQLPKAGIVRGDQVTQEALMRLPRTAAKKADRLVSAWVGAQHAYRVAQILVPAGIFARTTHAVIEELGENAAEQLHRNPWSLVGIRAIDVASADAAARVVLGGFDPQDPRRARAVVVDALRREASNGHTEAEREEILDEVRHAGIRDPDAAINAAIEEDLVAARGADCVALREYADAEASIAADIARLAAQADPWGDAKSVKKVAGDLDEVQRSAVLAAAEHAVSVLTGGPGTGKSRTVSAIVALAESTKKSVALAAPTGRAAKRLGELAGGEATTVHRLLGAQGRDLGFARDWEEPIEADVIVIDESSMLDAPLCAALLDACPDGAHVVFVGDEAQLPSIGPGRVLGDLIASQTVPVTTLTKLYRQAEGGQIASLATAVRGGELPPVDDPTHEVVVVGARGSAEAAHRTVQLVTDSIPRVFGLSASEIQVVTPVHRGPAGTKELNVALKAKLNPGPGAVSGFDIGDRVVATVNHLDATPYGYANGEVGTVVALGDKSVTVEFASGLADVSGKDLGDLLHGWAITVHRAQGSEWPAVVAVVPPESGRLLVRALVYTAFTRAERHLSIVHGSGPALAYAVRQRSAKPRRTSLVDRVRAKYAENA